ncbi:MAG TPA: hypothetical protein VHS33_03415 [Sphingomicrobium sp.]|nr:hypothetical protein [Sphingomicrobium sp.]
MSKSDREYYLARINAEREAAGRATDEAVRRVHLQLIERYGRRLSGEAAESAPDEEA